VQPGLGVARAPGGSNSSATDSPGGGRQRGESARAKFAKGLGQYKVVAAGPAPAGHALGAHVER